MCEARLIDRFGGDVRLALGSFKVATAAKFNDWGPYDYHRDFNLTFPAQLMADVSTVLGLPAWFDGVPQTRLGVRGTWRSLDEDLPRYWPAQVPNASGVLVCDPDAPGESERVGDPDLPAHRYVRNGREPLRQLGGGVARTD